MAKKGNSTVLNFLAWFTGVVVSLAVGNGMINNVLKLPSWLGGASSTGMLITSVIGWIVVITTIVSVILAILNK